jgi:eukaryotic-like serine/threonine-protein kinase
MPTPILEPRHPPPDEVGPAFVLPPSLEARYPIARELGRGAMGIVYLAQDRGRDRAVALKVIRPDVMHSASVDRFAREIRLAAQLDHPNIVPVLDAGRDEDVSWYTMPFVQGPSLRALLTLRGRLQVPDAVRIARDVALALDCAQAHGVVHRDVKPENILLDEDRALVVDFGIARRVIATADGDHLTGTGIVVGTPGYMSPEQAAGETVDGRADIYALGSVLYEMLAGEAPYVGCTAQIVLAKQMADPVPSVRRLRTVVSAELDRIVAAALAREPCDRFRTGGDFAAALEAVDLAHATLTVPQPVRYPLTPLRRAASLIVAGLTVTRRLLGSLPHGSRPPD